MAWTPISVDAQQRGYLRSQTCPFSCRTEGIPKNVCRDWREGNTCFVEDLRYPPESSRQSRAPALRSPYGSASDECTDTRRSDISPPRIDIFRVHARGSLLSDKWRVTGSVEGSCLIEAGYYERGRLVESISIPSPSTKRFGRYEFEVNVRGDRDPEIRVYNHSGDRDIMPIQSSEYDSRDRRW